MAYSDVHKKDTLKAIGCSLFDKDAEILQDLVHIVVDGQITKAGGGKEECLDLLEKLKNRNVITIDELYGLFIEKGASETCEKYGNKKDFLVAWLLPPHGPGHQTYTHKGWEYPYNEDDDKTYWKAQDINISWLVKKSLLVKAVRKIYGVSDCVAEAISILLYNVHRLRDIQYNEYTLRKDYLFNISDEIINDVLPKICDNELRSKVNDLVLAIQNKQKELVRTDAFWQELTEPIDKLIGSINSSEGGFATEIIEALKK